MSPYVRYRDGGIVSERPEFLTTEEAADILRVSTKTVLRRIRSGRLRACKPGRGYRIRVEDLPSPDDEQPVDVIYLDDNGSNPIDPIVRDAIVDALNDPPANASSVHANGASAQYRIAIAREMSLNSSMPQCLRWSSRPGQPKPTI